MAKKAQEEKTLEDIRNDILSHDFSDLRHKLYAHIGPAGHRQEIGGPEEAQITVVGVAPYLWPATTLIYIFMYGLKKILSDCVRSAVSGKKKPHGKRAITAAMQRAVDAKILKMTIGDVWTTVPTEVSECLTILATKADIKLDRRKFTTKSALEAWFPTSGLENATFEQLWDAGVEAAKVKREAEAKTKAINPFA